MGDRMRTIPFSRLLNWMREEYSKERKIFGIQEEAFFRNRNETRTHIFDEACSMPLGPAAGPHTQLAQNIISAYLVGGRFIELKTVQRLDELEIEKPCIDVRDEGYNTEWSQELGLEESIDEYIKAWIVLHVLEKLLEPRTKSDPLKTGGPKDTRSFIFNMSVGYDLEGIKSPKMDAFVKGLMDASAHPSFTAYLKELDSFIQDGSFIEAMGIRGKKKDFGDIFENISPCITRSVTLSTMHGCPPHEIEAICKYLMKEKALDTFVKLNPTLLGYERVRETLDALGYGSVELREEAFSKDLQWGDALGLLRRLADFSEQSGRHFGIKLSNTLGSVNNAGILPGEEMYMSGRALFPLTIGLASRISREFEGMLPISYSGGASELNIAGIFETGIKPITMATELLKPGGYARVKASADRLVPLLEKTQTERIDIEKLDRLAEEAVRGEYYRKQWRGKDRVRVEKHLPIFDCYVAPCVEACPIHQDVPAYIRFAGSGQYKKALEIIYMKNPLPGITGYICDHQCQNNCTRLDYERTVCIREMKRIAAEHGRVKAVKTAKKVDAAVAVIGAGPAGLAAAYFLARTGFRVTVFERQDSPGGVVAHVLPRFRIPESAVNSDISFIRAQGVDFRFGVSRKFTIEDLRREGYRYIFIAIGAEISKKLILEKENACIYDALEFLKAFNKDPSALSLGKKIAVVGGGNTAMDSARAAMRVEGVEEVSLIYRRTEEEMPADREEFENAIKDGVRFRPLLRPESFLDSGVLKCRKMRLGDPDSSGRRAPLPTEDFEDIEADSAISAIGESADLGILEEAGLKIGSGGILSADSNTLETDLENVFAGGDVFRGPSTVVEAMADAKLAAESIAKKEMPEIRDPGELEGPEFQVEEKRSEIYGKKGHIVFSHPLETDKFIAKHEALRCLECNIICNKCVDVCPNRANVPIEIPSGVGFRDRWQILHLDSLCNECGNCETFCPYDGSPYRDKLTLFETNKDFEKSTNDGFMAEGRAVTLRISGELFALKTDGRGNVLKTDSMTRELEKACAVIGLVLKRHRYLIG
jgi:putative selenate reductase